MSTEQINQEIAQAAELEGLAPMPEDLVPLQQEKLIIDQQIELLRGRLQEIKDEFGSRLESGNLQGYTLNGKVHARLSRGTRTTVDSKELKAKMPHIWSQFLKVTSYKSITIS